MTENIFLSMVLPFKNWWCKVPRSITYTPNALLHYAPRILMSHSAMLKKILNPYFSRRCNRARVQTSPGEKLLPQLHCRGIQEMKFTPFLLLSALRSSGIDVYHEGDQIRTKRIIDQSLSDLIFEYRSELLQRLQEEQEEQELSLIHI